MELNNNLNEYNIVMQDATKIKDVPIRKRNVNTDDFEGILPISFLKTQFEKVNIDDFEGILPSTNPTKPIQK